MDEQGKKEIIKEVNNLRDSIIDDVQDELETDELEKKVGMFEKYGVWYYIHKKKF